MKISRRDLSIGLGLSLLLGPLMRGELAERRAYASPSSTAKRLFLFFSPNGTVPSHYWPTGSGTSFSFPSGSILEPLAPIQSDIVVCKGINFSDFDNHAPGMSGMLTGEPSNGIFGGVSVDQYLAQKLNTSAPFRSIELGVLTDIWGAQNQTRMSYTAPGVFASPQQDPQAAFQRLFAGVAGASGAGDAGATMANVAARRKSVLDFVTADVQSLQNRLGAAERYKLDDHLTAIRAVEASLFPPAGSTSSAAACTSASAPGTPDPTNMANFPTIGKAQMDLAVLAMKCGLAPVVSLQWSFTVSPVVFSWLNLSSGHHDLSHAQNADFITAERWYAQQFAYLVGQMKSAGLLADSLVVWVKELADSSLHNAVSVPMVIAGQAGGSIQTGRLVDFGGVSHHLLLSSIVQAMGGSTSGLGADAAGLQGLFS
ncbi:MAG TPA: DUF1552 domain-containing protein [Polyangiaceae bacterium]|jgi:hypothetical protein